MSTEIAACEEFQPLGRPERADVAQALEQAEGGECRSGLQNVLERAVILACGEVLGVAEFELPTLAGPRPCGSA